MEDFIVTGTIAIIVVSEDTASLHHHIGTQPQRHFCTSRTCL